MSAVLLRAIGQMANGWLKFIVALVAVGWFGLQALEAAGDDESASISVVSQSVGTIDGGLPDESVEASSEFRLSAVRDHVMRFMSQSGGNLIFGLISAYFLGFVSRPGFDWFSRKRRIRSAKKRARLHEEDMELLSQIETSQN